MIVPFIFLACMTLLSALGVVLSRNVVHSALFMSGSFLGVAGFFVVLNAPALAAFQVLIYVGAVAVLMLFGIMFTQQPSARSFSTILNRQVWMGFAVALGLAGVLSYFLTVQDWGDVSAGNGPRSVVTFGENLLGVGSAPDIFALLYQVAAVLLFVAIVAAIVISRRRIAGEEGEE